MNTLLLIVMIISSPVYLLGMFVLYHIFRGQTSPADKSNRINKIRLVWFALTREELFVNTFPWMKNDELDNVK